MATLAPPCKPYRQRRPNASDRLRIPRSTVDSDSSLNLTTWFSYHVVPFWLHTFSISRPRRTIIPLFTNHNVTACQSTQVHQERTQNPCQQSLYNHWKLLSCIYIFFFPFQITYDGARRQWIIVILGIWTRFLGNIWHIQFFHWITFVHFICLGTFLKIFFAIFQLSNYWKKKNWIPMGISAMRNAYSLVQDLNCGHRAHFIRNHITEPTPPNVSVSLDMVMLYWTLVNKLKNGLHWLTWYQKTKDIWFHLFARPR